MMLDNAKPAPFKLRRSRPHTLTQDPFDAIWPPADLARCDRHRFGPPRFIGRAPLLRSRCLPRCVVIPVVAPLRGLPREPASKVDAQQRPGRETFGVIGVWRRPDASGRLSATH